MKKECLSCHKEFIAKKEVRNYCSMKCYQSRFKRKEIVKVDLMQLVFDGAQILIPILILAFAIFYITPKTVNWITEEKVELVKDIPDSCCDDFELEINDEDMKFRDFIKTKR